MISDAHEGLKAACAKVLKATWQRCRVHFMRNVLATVPKGQRRVVSALIGTILAQEGAEAARTQWRTVADQLRGRFTKAAQFLDSAEQDVLAHMTFPREHWAVTDRPIGATNDRLNGATSRPRRTGLERVQFQGVFGVLATADFGASGVGRGLR